MNVSDLCNRTVVICRKEDSVIDAAGKMRAFHVGDLVVVEDQGDRRVPVGIVTDRDLVVSVLARHSKVIDSLKVGDIYSTDLVTALEEESLPEALAKMRAHGVRRLPVVNRRGELEGILTFDDVVELLAEELTELAELPAREQRREREQRV